MMRATSAHATEAQILSCELLISACCTSGAVGETVYGLTLLLSDDNRLEFPDIAAEQHSLQPLRNRLLHQFVCPVSLPDIIEDYVEELAGNYIL